MKSVVIVLLLIVLPASVRLQVSRGDSGQPASAPGLAWTSPQAIEGYGDKITLNHGESIGFHVRSSKPTYNINILRIGWYDGAGTKTIQTVQGLTGHDYPIP